MKLLPLVFPFFLITPLVGQVFTPPTQQKTPKQKGPATTNIIEKKPASNEGSPFGEEVPLLNPGDETVTIGGLTLPLGDNRVMRSRFEKYLNQQEEDEELTESYHATLDEIISLLAPRPGDRKPRQEKVAEAFSLLPIAAGYSGDAKISQSLAETIYASLQAKRDVDNLAAFNESLEKQTKQLSRDADWHLRHAKRPKVEGSRPVQEGGEGRRNRAQVERATSQRHLQMLKQIAENEASKKKNLLQSEQQILQTKIQFQATMMQWVLQRRFHHVIIASRFYNVIWQDGDNALHIRKNSTMAKLFSESLGFSPTVTALDSVSNEAVRDTANGVDAVSYLMEKNELHSATKRLLEAFVIGEFLEPIATLDRDKKRKIQSYSNDLFSLYDAIQARDYGRARELTIKLKGQATDFPSSKAESVISGNVIASNLAITRAKKALAEDNEEQVVESIQKATELWPTNPKLLEFSELMDSGVDLTHKVKDLKGDFKRLLAEKNYREIAKRQYEFAPVVQDDPEDLDAFTQVVTNLKEIETAILTAEGYTKKGDPYGAWEQLDLLRQRFPDDPKLGREMELLAPKVADLTKALDQARELESRSPPQTGSAISYYLKAKTIYPNSQYASEGLKNLIDSELGQ